MPLFPTRPGNGFQADDNAQGETPFYNDAYLRRYDPAAPINLAEHPELVSDVTRDRVPGRESDNNGSVDRMLAAARESLARANAFGAMNNSADVARIPEEAAALEASNASRARPSFRNFTETLAKGGGTLGTAGLVAGVTPAAPLAPAMLLGGDLLAAPNVVRQLVSPDADESRLGALGQAGLMALGGAASMRGLRKAAAAEQAAAEAPALEVRDQVRRAREYVKAGATPQRAGQTVGGKLGQSEEIFMQHGTPEADRTLRTYAQPRDVSERAALRGLDPNMRVFDNGEIAPVTGNPTGPVYGAANNRPPVAMGAPTGPRPQMGANFTNPPRRPFMGAQFTNAAPEPPVQTPMEALRAMSASAAEPGAELGQAGFVPAGPTAARDEINAIRNLLRARSARELAAGY